MIHAPVFLLLLLSVPVTPASVPVDHGRHACCAAARRAQPEDRWFAEDKMRHLAMAFATTGFSQAGARAAGATPDAATAIGVAASIVASLGKEVFDRKAGGHFSVRDLVWDAAGIVLGVVMVRNAR